jgi:hypothetical protein
VKGGIRNPYVDVPVKSYHIPNSGAEPPIKNPHPFIAARGEAAQNQLCGLANYEVPLTAAQLKKLYKDNKDYQNKVQQRYDELVKSRVLPTLSRRLYPAHRSPNFSGSQGKATD